MNQNVQVDFAEWKKVRYLKIHADGPENEHPWAFEVILPEPLASWDTFSYWEKERTYSMRDNLKKGDVLFDIGAENGWLSAVYAQFVGGENMVLFEPSPEYWPNLKATWRANSLANPKGCFVGLVGDRISRQIDLHKDWPIESDGRYLQSGLRYRYLHESSATSSSITIDEYVKLTGTIPAALTVDTEGAEILVVKGARETLRRYKPLVWLSEHPDLALRDGYGDVKNIREFMAALGYNRHYLATDHEEHILYWHPDRGEPVL